MIVVWIPSKSNSFNINFRISVPCDRADAVGDMTKVVFQTKVALEMANLTRRVEQDRTPFQRHCLVPEQNSPSLIRHKCYSWQHPWPHPLAHDLSIRSSHRLPSLLLEIGGASRRSWRVVRNFLSPRSSSLVHQVCRPSRACVRDQSEGESLQRSPLLLAIGSWRCRSRKLGRRQRMGHLQRGRWRLYVLPSCLSVVQNLTLLPRICQGEPRNHFCMPSQRSLTVRTTPPCAPVFCVLDRGLWDRRTPQRWKHYQSQLDNRLQWVNELILRRQSIHQNLQAVCRTHVEVPELVSVQNLKICRWK